MQLKLTHQLTRNPLAIVIAAVLVSPTWAQQQQPDTDKTVSDRIEIVYKRSSVMSEITEDSQKLMAMPGTNGDPLQAAFALPGVVAAGGASGSPAVRGSSPEDNLFEIDFMPAGYLFHDFGTSIFNKHLIQDFQLHSAGYGSSYSGATGAVFDVTLRTPKHQPIQTTIDLSLFNSGIFVEGQISENSAFYFSARKSMLSYFFKEGEELEDDDGELTGITINDPFDDSDYQGKWVWDVNSNNMLSVSFTGARDSAGANFNQRSELALKSPEYLGDAIFNRKFDSQSIIWDHFGNGIQIKMGVGVLNNKERLELGKTAATNDSIFIDEINKQISYKARVNYKLSQSHHLLLDAAYYDVTSEYNYDLFHEVCTDIDPDCDVNKGPRIQDSNVIDNDSQFVALSDIWDINSQLQAEIGVQWQHNQYTDESFILPRLALSYFVTENSIITAKYGGYNRQQDIDTILPKLGNPELKSQTAQHATLGFEQHLADEWSWSIESYYKTMDDLPLALAQSEPDADLFYSNDVEGKAYGVDLLINKNITDDWYGWLSLSYSKSERTNLRNNHTIDYYADTPLVVNMVLNYQINERWNAGINFTARSGQPYTPIIGIIENPDYDDRYLPVYGEAFSERFDVNHRLDVRVERKTDFFGLDAMLVFEVMNVYGQENVSYIDLDYQNISSADTLLLKEEEDDFGIRPSIGFSFTF
ncbi:TonB-dependent receptor [Alteromonadaceae bacterium BrNp21-10]|nr:TonB-dependent receptor [Alteromonadaceae bacterium BrNp21-10]